MPTVEYALIFIVTQGVQMAIPEGGEQTSGEKIATKSKPSPNGRGAKERGNDVNVRRGKGPRAGGMAAVSGVAGSKRKRTSGLVSLSEIHKDELMAVAGEHWARGAAVATGTSAEAASTRGKFKSKLVSMSVPEFVKLMFFAICVVACTDGTPSKNTCRHKRLTFC